MEDQEIASITIRCFLCQGYVLFKDGDLERFRAHLANQHGVFFGIDYLLASCFMDDEQRTSIAKPFIDSLQSENMVQQESELETDEAHETTEKPKTKKEKSSSKAKSPKVKPFPCDVCPKSYGSKQSLKVHTKSGHTSGNPPKDGIKTESEELLITSEVPLKEEDDFSSNVDSPVDLVEELNKELESLDSSLDVTIDETNSTMEETNSTMEEVSNTIEDTKDHDNEMDAKKKSKKKSEKSSKISADSRWKALTEKLLQQGIDITQSPYFTKTKQVLSDGEKFQDKFTEAVPGLPENWKYRTVDVKDKGKVVVLKHFLSPECVLMKSAMAVVEYLRMEGKLKPDEILEVAKTLKVGNRKLQKLFSNDAGEPAVGTEDA